MRMLRTQLHPGLLPADPTIRARWQRGPHLALGELSGACGVYALWSALITLGVATVAQVKCIRLFADDAFKETWVRGLDTFFLGADEDELFALAKSLGRYVRPTLRKGSMRELVGFVIHSLRGGEVVLLGLESRTGQGGHWTLACGIEEQVSNAGPKVIGILCLDSAEPAPQLLRFNTRLELNVPHFGSTYVRYRKPNGDGGTMTIDSAISLGRRRGTSGRPRS